MNPRPLPYQGSALPLSHTGTLEKKPIGAGEGNRTLVISLEGFSSTIELHPPPGTTFLQLLMIVQELLLFPCRFYLASSSGGGGWIRTIVGVSQQIYSLPLLAAQAPLRDEEGDYADPFAICQALNIKKPLNTWCCVNRHLVQQLIS